MKRAVMMAAAAMALIAGCDQAASPTATSTSPSVATSEATVTEAASPDMNSQVATPASTGPLDGLWRCKMNGDIPLGTLAFTGGNYTFQTTNTAWEPNPNASDGSGTVTFEETFVLPQTGPLKDAFAVTGAFGDGSFINFNTDLGMMFGCRRP
jgi:hypothetical protein